MLAGNALIFQLRPRRTFGPRLLSKHTPFWFREPGCFKSSCEVGNSYAYLSS